MEYFLDIFGFFMVIVKLCLVAFLKYIKNLTLYLTLNKAWSRSRFGVSKLQLRLRLRPSQKPTTPTPTLTPAFQKPTTPATPTPTPTPTPQPWLYLTTVVSFTMHILYFVLKVT